jgi:hypothetical protein
MNTRTFLRTMAVAWLTLSSGVAAALADRPSSAADKPVPKSAAYKISGPHSYQNLTIFLIHGEDQLKNKTFLTLQEALEQKKAIVYETQQVNQLTIENVSPTEEVFVQAGDIVKGGKQDRVIAFDVILPARSGKMPIASFCVEAGRWTQRGRENPAAFEVSRDQAPTKDLKLAIRKDMAQHEVWNKVAEGQVKLAGNLGTSVQAATSRSSLQLTLENPKLQEAVKNYVGKLQSVGDGQNDVIGYAAAVNGVLDSADVYASHALFAKLWPTLLKGSAVEAVTEVKKGGPDVLLTKQMVLDFLADAERGAASHRSITSRVQVIQQETTKNIVFTCADEEQHVAIRRSYVHK